MNYVAEHELLCRNFGGHWSDQHRTFFCTFEERVDFQKLSMKNMDNGRMP
jgi:hypothetical protein